MEEEYGLGFPSMEEQSPPHFYSLLILNSTEQHTKLKFNSSFRAPPSTGLTQPNVLVVHLISWAYNSLKQTWACSKLCSFGFVGLGH